MSFRPDRPYNDLPPLPPAVDVETKAVLRACITARVALAELKVAGQLIPNQAVLINSIPLLEAQASSEIENIVTTTDRLFRFANESGNQADPATKEALRYRTALDRILFMLDAIRETSNWSTAKIRAIRDLLDQTTERVRRDRPKISSRELVELIFVHPYCRIGDLVAAGIAKRQSAAAHLTALTDLGLLKKVKAGRENLYINPPLLALLSETAF